MLTGAITSSLLAVLLTGSVAQNRPDFSGRWLHAGGQVTMVVEQRADELRVEEIQGGLSVREGVLRLNGSEHIIPAEGQTAPGLVMSARWVSGTLVIVETRTGPGGGPRIVRQTWTRDSNRLTVEFVHLDDIGETLRRMSTTFNLVSD